MPRNGRDNQRGVAIVVALLVCGALNAIHRQNERSHGHDPVTGIVRDAALVPAQTATVRVARWFRLNVASIFQGPRLARQNSELRAEVLVLSVQNKQLAGAQSENDRLRSLLDFQKHSPRPLLAAEVTALKPTPQNDTIVLNRGIDNGVHVHSIVVAANGSLVGQVIDVSAHSCIALMLTDLGSSVGAQVNSGTPPSTPAVSAPKQDAVKPSKPAADADGHDAKPATGGKPAADAASPAPAQRPVGVCRGMGGTISPVLTYLKSDANIKVGDTVTTSGLGIVFPAGLPIGKIVSVKTDYTESMKTAVVRPSADLDHLDEAFILQ